jgi:hypothetical protein
MENTALATLELSDRYFQRYWVHVEVRMPTPRLKKLIALHTRRKPYSKFKADAHYFIMSSKLKKRGMSLLDATILPMNASRIVPQKARTYLFSDIQKLLDKLDQRKGYDGDSGTVFMFPRIRFRFKGGFSLPIKFGMDESVTERIGVAEVRGLQLFFKTSPIGLDSAMLSVSDKYVMLGIETGFYHSPLSALVEQTYTQAKRIGSLFVEGETN